MNFPASAEAHAAHKGLRAAAGGILYMAAGKAAMSVAAGLRS
jgi:hypothetical protein